MHTPNNSRWVPPFHCQNLYFKWQLATLTVSHWGLWLKHCCSLHLICFTVCIPQGALLLCTKLLFQVRNARNFPETNYIHKWCHKQWITAMREAGNDKCTLNDGPLKRQTGQQIQLLGGGMWFNMEGKLLSAAEYQGGTVSRIIITVLVWTTKEHKVAEASCTSENTTTLQNVLTKFKTNEQTKKYLKNAKM